MTIDLHADGTRWHLCLFSILLYLLLIVVIILVLNNLLVVLLINYLETLVFITPIDTALSTYHCVMTTIPEANFSCVVAWIISDRRQSLELTSSLAIAPSMHQSVVHLDLLSVVEASYWHEVRIILSRAHHWVKVSITQDHACLTSHNRQWLVDICCTISRLVPSDLFKTGEIVNIVQAS